MLTVGVRIYIYIINDKRSHVFEREKGLYERLWRKTKREERRRNDIVYLHYNLKK